MKQPITKAHKERFAAIARNGCIISSCGRPCEIHHLRKGVGMGKRGIAERTIGLCEIHHRTGGYGVAIHAGKKAFEEKFGTEDDLLCLQNKILEL